MELMSGNGGMMVAAIIVVTIYLTEGGDPG